MSTTKKQTPTKKVKQATTTVVKVKVSQKELVHNFMASLPENVTKRQAWEMFQISNPTFSKANFDFYRNQAENQGIYVCAPEPTTVAAISLKPIEPILPEYKKIDLEAIDIAQFTPIQTNTAFDVIASKRNGLMKSTAYIITGESGAGKTTIATNIADYLKEATPSLKVGFISAEMDENDWTEECIDNKRLADLETIFMLNYLDTPNYVEILAEALKRWDYVVLDSFEVILDQLKEVKGWTTKKAETELINMLRVAAFESGACIMAIQQWTKSGGYVGSTKIKHMLTGMIYVMFDKNGDRYITFTKNRRGGHMVGKHLYFTKNKETGRLEFDGEKLMNDIAIKERINEDLQQIETENGLFDTAIMEIAKKQEAERNARKAALSAEATPATA